MRGWNNMEARRFRNLQERPGQEALQPWSS
uniref:Uncharacterized protein n=1 Tax=Anguilla anguilla TaxID=7936 RepID=A0A0E9UM01_ANGAN